MVSKIPTTGRGPARSRPTRSRPDDRWERIAARLEEILEQGRAVRTAIEAQGVALGARIDALRDDLSPRVGALELAVRHNSQDIRGLRQSVDTLTERVDTLTKRVDNLSDRMERVETKLDTKAETAVVREINRRVSALDRRPPAEA